MKEIVKKIDSPHKKEIMSTADMLKAEGKVEGRIEGKIEGIMEGKIEGKTESTYHFIQNCYDKNFDIDTIAELVALSRDEVYTIINDLKEKKEI